VGITYNHNPQVLLLKAQSLTPWVHQSISALAIPNVGFLLFMLKAVILSKSRRVGLAPQWRIPTEPFPPTVPPASMVEG